MGNHRNDAIHFGIFQYPGWDLCQQCSSICCGTELYHFYSTLLSPSLATNINDDRIDRTSEPSGFRVFQQVKTAVYYVYDTTKLSTKCTCIYM